MVRPSLTLPLLALVACKSTPVPPPAPAPVPPPVATAPGPAAPPRTYDAVPRAEVNRLAARENLPLYWIGDADRDGTIDPGEVASLLFYPTREEWVEKGAFTPAFEAAYARIVAAAAVADDLSSEEGRRRALVGKDLDQGRPTLVASDLAGLPASGKQLVRRMLRVAELVDELYEIQNGAKALAAKLPRDPASRSLFRRNRGPRCVAPATEKEPLCSAIPGSPRPIFDLYPAELQTTDGFCAALEKHPDAKALLSPFTVVRGTGTNLTAVPMATAYAAQMGAIATELRAAAEAIRVDPAEQPLVAYLEAAAVGFETNDWVAADEAWARMTVDNSSWYVRVGPDEVYWEPCASKAGLHLTFARINQGSRAWQQKLVPVQQEMEAQIARAAGRPYLARKVTFHLPDFIDLVVNAGDDRDALGATIGQSLPNWGPVANEGRGRTVAMVNLYGDPDSLEARRGQAESVLDAASLAAYAGTTEPGLLSTILHEATHNLGPAHEYKVGGKVDDAVFGGPLASVMEELKAQTGALFLLELLRTKGLITDELAMQSYADAIVWALGHVSQGMYTGTGSRKTYGNVAAIQIGYLLDAGALRWDPAAMAANGKDRGALAIDFQRLVPAVGRMMKDVASIKAQGARARAEALARLYVDGKVVPHATIQERFQRFPKASFVYALSL